MTEIELTLLQLRINLIEELLCRNIDFRNPYLEALNVISAIAEEQQEDNSQEFVLAIKDLMARINKTPS